MMSGGMDDPSSAPPPPSSSSSSLSNERPVLHGRAAAAAAASSAAASSAGAPLTSSAPSEGHHALAARLSVGLMQASRQAGELSRFMDTADASRAPLATFELLVGRLQAAEEALSTLRGCLEGHGGRENVCASLLRRADTAHALEEAQRQSQRTATRPQTVCVWRHMRRMRRR